jgi:hypothetical protein
MTQEERDILLKDICARLPYNVKAYVKHWSSLEQKYYEGVYDVKSAFPSLNEIHVQSSSGAVNITLGYYEHEFKPYLFPMSSMTEEQKAELMELMYKADTPFGAIFSENIDYFDWLNKHHFDYRGLIPKGLAIDATGLNIY